MKSDQEIINCLVSELSNLIFDFKSNTLSEADLYNYFRNFLEDANIDSRIIVKVLEDERFGDLAKDEALSIKIDEGW